MAVKDVAHLHREYDGEKNIILDKLIKSLDKVQLQLLDEQNELANEIHSIEYEQLFMFGYIIGKELDIECKNK